MTLCQASIREKGYNARTKTLCQHFIKEKEAVSSNCKKNRVGLGKSI